MDESLETLKNIVKLYENADMKGKQYIIGSIFPEKFVFDGEMDRTARMNLAFQLIYHINNKLDSKKKGVNLKFKTNSNQVLSDTFRTHQFLNDLKVVADMKKYIDDMRSTRFTFSKR